jgi:hypothetical protein
VIDAYGAGPQPIIDGGMNTAAVQLIGQQGWEIDNLEVVGGNYYGVNIAGTAPNTAYTHFRLTNLNIHGAHHTAATNDSGEVFITIGNAGETINDIVIDGVTAHDSQVFNGIFIDAGVFPTSTSPEMLGNNSRNCRCLDSPGWLAAVARCRPQRQLRLAPQVPLAARSEWSTNP